MCFFLGRTYFTCKYCPRPYCCGNDRVTTSKTHEKTTNHSNVAKSLKGSQVITASSKKAGNLKNWVWELELQVAMFIIQKNLPIAIADDLMDFIKNTDLDKDTRTKVTCDGTKCTALIQKGHRKIQCWKNRISSAGEPLLVDNRWIYRYTNEKTSSSVCPCSRWR